MEDFEFFFSLFFPTWFLLPQQVVVMVTPQETVFFFYFTTDCSELVFFIDMKVFLFRQKSVVYFMSQQRAAYSLTIWPMLSNQ